MSYRKIDILAFGEGSIRQVASDLYGWSGENLDILPEVFVERVLFADDLQSPAATALEVTSKPQLLFLEKLPEGKFRIITRVVGLPTLKQAKQVLAAIANNLLGQDTSGTNLTQAFMADQDGGSNSSLPGPFSGGLNLPPSVLLLLGILCTYKTFRAESFPAKLVWGLAANYTFKQRKIAEIKSRIEGIDRREFQLIG